MAARTDDWAESEERQHRLPEIDPFEHELRFVVDRPQLIALLGQAAPHTVREIHDVSRPVSFTRTLYLDTDDLEYLRSSATTVLRRLRVREYASATDIGAPALLTGRCFIEFKTTTSTSRSKARVEASPDEIESLIATSGHAHPRPLGATPDMPIISDELARAVVRPRLTTWYRRICLLGREQPLRLTIDEDLAFCQPQPLGRKGEKALPSQVVARGPRRIVEVKWIGQRPAWLVEATRELTIRPPESSKFHLGMSALQEAGALCEAETLLSDESAGSP